MELSQDERQKILELIDKVSPCAAISEKENLEKGINNAADAAYYSIDHGFDMTMNRYNKK